MKAEKSSAKSFLSIRFLLTLAAGFIAAFLAAGSILLLALPSLLSSDFARQKIEGYLTQELKKPVSIGAISFSWGEGLAVSNFRSVNKDQSPFINLSDLKLLLSWSSLLSGKLDIVTLDIRGIDVTVTRDKEGRTTVSELLGTPAQAVSPKKASKSSAVTLPDLFLNARVEDGNFSFIDERLNSTTRIRGLHADVSIPSLREPLKISLKGDVILNDNPPESIALSGTASFAPGGEVDLQKGTGSLEMKAGFGTMNLFFDLAQMHNSREATGARFSCKLDLKKLTQLAAAVAGLPPGFSMKGTLQSGFETRGSFESRIALNGKTEVANLLVQGGPFHVSPLAQPRVVFSHDINLAFDTGVIEVKSVAVKSDFLNLAISGTVNDFQKNPRGRLLLSGGGTLNDIMPLLGTVLSLPPDLKLLGSTDLSLAVEGDFAALTMRGTTAFNNLEVHAAFLNNHPFREKSLRVNPDLLLSLSENTSVKVNALTIKSEMLNGDVTGTVDGAGSVDLKGKLSTSLALLKKNLQGILPDSFPREGQLLSDLTVRGNLNQSLAVQGNHTIDGAQIVLPPAPGGQSASASPSTFSFPRLAVAHDADYQGDQDRLSLKELEVVSSLGTIKGSGTLSRLSGDLLTNCRGELSLSMPEVVTLVKDLLPEGLVMKGKGDITFAGEGSLSPPDNVPVLSTWNGSGSVLIETADYAGIGVIQNLRSRKLSLTQGVLDIALECLLNGGPTTIEGSGNLSSERPDVTLAFDSKDITLSQDVTLLGYIVPILIIPDEGRLTGKGSVSAALAWQGFDWETEMVKTIKGTGRLRLSDGSILSQNVLSEILKAFGKPEKLQFDEILTNFRLSEEKVYNDNIQLNGKDLNLNLKGWTSLAHVPSQKGNPMEYSVTGDLIQKSIGKDAEKVLSILGGGEANIPVVIAGTIQNPRVSIKLPKAADIFKGIFSPLQKGK